MKCVLATDGTESSLKAATWLAENICLGAESDIYLVYVFPIPSHPEATPASITRHLAFSGISDLR